MRRKSLHLSNCLISINSFGLWACLILPGPQTIVSKPISLKIPASVPKLTADVEFFLSACRHNDIKLEENKDVEKPDENKDEENKGEEGGESQIDEEEGEEEEEEIENS